MTIGDGQPCDGYSGGEIFKYAGIRVAVNRQISSTGAVDGDVVGNLKFAADQQDGAGDAGGVNRVAIVCVNQRLAQRAWPAVIGVCDYDDVSWQRMAYFTNALLALPNLAALWFRSVSLCQRERAHANRQQQEQIKCASDKMRLDGMIGLFSHNEELWGLG